MRVVLEGGAEHLKLAPTYRYQWDILGVWAYSASTYRILGGEQPIIVPGSFVAG